MTNNVVQFPGPRDEEGPGATDAFEPEPEYQSHGAELEVLEGNILPAPVTSRRVPSVRDYTFTKPTWTGAKSKAKAGAGFSVKAVWVGLTRALPILLFILLPRWFWFGMGSWPNFFAWIFAVDERQDLKEVTYATRGKGGRGAPRIKAGTSADALMVRRGVAVLVGHGALAYVIGTQLGTGYWFLLLAAPAVIPTLVIGCRRDVKPMPTINLPRTRQDATEVAMNNALRSPGVGILVAPKASNPAPERVRQIGLPQDVGIGKLTRWDLPASCGRSATDVVKVSERLASVFATPLDQFHVEVGSHAAQYTVWQSPRSPFDPRDLPTHPLLKAESWDVWNPGPFARNYRHEEIRAALVFTSWLIGARPRRGKSFAARSLLAQAVLDPYVRFSIFDGKYGETWLSAKPLCEPGHYITGDDDEDAKAVLDALESLVADMRKKHKRIKGSKLSREQTRDPLSDLWIHVVVMDEAQLYITHKVYGAQITACLEILAKVGPSAGYVLVVITQRPDSDSFPTTLRAVLGARFCLQVMSYQDSNIVLGPDMSTFGFDASKIRYVGVGYLRPDDDANGQPDSWEACIMAQTFDMSDDVWASVCEYGAGLRERLAGEAKELEGSKVEIPDELLRTSDLLDRIRAYAPDDMRAQPWAQTVQTLGNYLGGVGKGALKVPTEKIPGAPASTRGRWRSEVEEALGLPVGALAEVSGGASETYPEGPPEGDPKGPRS